MGGVRPGGPIPTPIPKLDWELINGNIDQSVAYTFKQYEPVNGSWIQAMVGTKGLLSEPTNGSWEYTLLYNTYVESNYYDPLVTDILINGNIWQSIWIYLDGELRFESIGLEGINYPVNGSWKNNVYQLYCSLFGGIPEAIDGEDYIDLGEEGGPSTPK
jgi:hypothetical protein